MSPALRSAPALAALALSCSERPAPPAVRAGAESPAAAPHQAERVPAERAATATEGAALDAAAKPPAGPVEKATHLAADGSPAVPRIHAKARFAWIQKAPRGSPGWIGYLSYGGSLPLRGKSVEAARTIGKGCESAWYAVEPIGYVCAGESATLDASDPVVVALAADAPDVESPWPYNYGESLGAPRYTKVPDQAAQRRAEWDLDKHLEAVEKVRRGGSVKYLEGVDLSPAEAGPPPLVPMSPLVRDERKFVAGGSTVAYTRSFDVGGRAFLLASDEAILPRDRVRPYPRSSFHGVAIGGEEKLPIAFFRHADVPRMRRDGNRFQPAGGAWKRLDHVSLTGAKVIVDPAHVYWETRDEGLWALEGDASVVDAVKPPLDVSGPGRHTWLDVSILGGTMVAYEGERPVYATLISPGRGGIPVEGKDPLETASTPTGTFRVDGKFVTATMVSSTNDDLVHTEVQFVQNFHGPHALHGAYWHDAWGEPKSGGCVNLSPVDAKWLFGFTEPKMPDGWYGLRSTGDFGPATWVVLHR